MENLLWYRRVVNTLLYITVSLTRIYPGTTQILLTINVNTWLQSRELSTPLQRGRSRWLLMSTQTQAIDRPMPQLCTRSTQLQSCALSKQKGALCNVHCAVSGRTSSRNSTNRRDLVSYCSTCLSKQGMITIWFW